MIDVSQDQTRAQAHVLVIPTVPKLSGRMPQRSKNGFVFDPEGLLLQGGFPPREKRRFSWYEVCLLGDHIQHPSHPLDLFRGASLHECHHPLRRGRCHAAPHAPSRPQGQVGKR